MRLLTYLDRMRDAPVRDTWELGFGPSESELDDCRYEESRCAAEIAVDGAAAAKGISLTTEQREIAIEEMLEAGVAVRWEEDERGDSFTPTFRYAVPPVHAIREAQRLVPPRRAYVVARPCGVLLRRTGRRALRRQRRCVRRPARAPGRSEDPHERVASSRVGGHNVGGRS
jgi:hypothetical protein